MNYQNNVKWSAEELERLAHSYELGGLRGAQRALPHRSWSAIKTAISRHSLCRSKITPQTANRSEGAVGRPPVASYQQLKMAACLLLERLAAPPNCPEGRLALAVITNELKALGTPREQPWSLVDGSLDWHLAMCEVDEAWWRGWLRSSGILGPPQVRKIRERQGGCGI
jgi:hypothetical protein